MLVHINKNARLRKGFLIEVLPYFNTADASWYTQLYRKKNISSLNQRSKKINK